MIRPVRSVVRVLAGVATLAAALGAVPAAGQVRGVVVDGAERPVAQATVELWMESRPAAASRTDEQGRFEIPGGPADGPLRLTVRRLGLATQVIPLASRDTTLRVTMEEQAVPLLSVAVEATAGRLCPRREEPRARALWTGMRGRYWQPGADTPSVFGFAEFRSGTGEKRDAFDARAARTRVGWTTGSLIIAHPELMALSGYATRAAGGVGERTAFWHYRALDGGAMQDFTGEFFGTAHTFAILRQTAEETTVAFCPRERMGRTGQIQGTLTLRPDTTLAAARWTFHTPRPDEDAGGEASYYPPNPIFGRALLTRESVFWRKSGRAYYYETSGFARWSLNPVRRSAAPAAP